MWHHFSLDPGQSDSGETAPDVYHKGLPKQSSHQWFVETLSSQALLGSHYPSFGGVRARRSS